MSVSVVELKHTAPPIESDEQLMNEEFEMRPNIAKTMAPAA